MMLKKFFAGLVVIFFVLTMGVTAFGGDYPTSAVQLLIPFGAGGSADFMGRAIAKAAEGRVAHVHLKDVDEAMAKQVRSGELAFRQAVIDGIFKPLGEGAVDIAGFVGTLEDAGYEGWYVLEQDCVLDADPAPGEGPLGDAKKSFDYLAGLKA